MSNTSATNLRSPLGRARGLDRTVPAHMLWPVVNVIFALAALLGLESFTEFALGLVLGCLFLAGFVTSAHEANSYR